MLPMHILLARLPSDGTTEAPMLNVGANARCTRIGKLIGDCREMPKKFGFPNELIDKVIAIS